MELICPSCEARYQLPEGSISARGRQVSCMNCGHSWHALPPMALGDPAQGGQGRTPSDPGGIKYVPPDGAPRPGERRVQEAPYSEMGGGMGPVPTTPQAAPVEAAGTGGQAGSDATRSEQMAEIRKMLAEVQSEERARAALKPEAERTQIVAPTAAAAATGAGMRSAEEDAERARARLQEEREQAERAARRAEAAENEVRDSERDFRRRKEQQADKKKAKRTDVKRLRKKHDRKVNQHKHASKAGSGAFLTGFLLIAIIAATMVALYVLAPQIVARVPSAEEPMREYVETMNRLREGASETIAGVQEWLNKQFGDKEG